MSSFVPCTQNYWTGGSTLLQHRTVPSTALKSRPAKSRYVPVRRCGTQSYILQHHTITPQTYVFDFRTVGFSCVNFEVYDYRGF